MHHMPVSRDEVASTQFSRNARWYGTPEFAGALVERARAALGTDIGVVRRLLDQLSVVLEEPHPLDAIGRPVAPTAEAVKGGLACWQMRLIFEYVDDHLGETIAVGALSSMLELSTGHLRRAFKISSGDTLHTYVLHKRVERAQILMLHTKDTLSQVALACGLTDQAHLTRLFRKFVGQTPLAWRRTWQERVQGL